MLLLQEREDLQPEYPHCGIALDRLFYHRIRQMITARRIYFCPECRKVLGVSHDGNPLVRDLAAVAGLPATDTRYPCRASAPPSRSGVRLFSEPAAVEQGRHFVAEAQVLGPLAHIERQARLAPPPHTAPRQCRSVDEAKDSYGRAQERILVRLVEPAEGK